MKHYALPYFPQTEQEQIDHYLVKYGDNVANLNRGKGWDWDNNILSQDAEARAMVGNPSGKIPRNQSLNKHGEVNGNVILNKNGTEPLGIVKPYDMLLILGHGVQVKDRPWAERIGDVSGDLTATSNDVAKWLAEDGRLKKNHVLLKVVMCLGGGRFGERVSDDNFAKQLVSDLKSRGYDNLAVGGYRGKLHAGTATVTIGPAKGELNLPSTVFRGESFSRATQKAPAKDNLDYYHGSPPVLISKSAIALVKTMFRTFVPWGNTGEDHQRLDDFVKRAMNQLDNNGAVFLKGAASVVMTAGGTGQPQQNIPQPVIETKQAVKTPVIQSRVQTPTNTAIKPVPQLQPQLQPQVQTPTPISSTSQKQKLCPKCGVWPWETKGWVCPNFKTCQGRLTAYSG